MTSNLESGQRHAGRRGHAIRQLYNTVLWDYKRELCLSRLTAQREKASQLIARINAQPRIYAELQAQLAARKTEIERLACTLNRIEKLTARPGFRQHLLRSLPARALRVLYRTFRRTLATTRAAAKSIVETLQRLGSSRRLVSKSARRSLFAAAKSASKAGNWSAAISRWHAVFDAFGGAAPPSAYVQLCRAYRRTGDFGAAETLIDLGRIQYPEVLSVAIEFAQLAVSRDDWSEALDRWKSILYRFGEAVPVLVYAELSRAHRILGDYEAAETVIQKAPHREHIRLATEYAEIAMARQDWATAISRWQLVLDEALREGARLLSSANLARLQISVARRLADIDAFKSEVVRYGRSEHSQVAGLKAVLYTAISGTYDSLQLPEYPDPRLEYVLFTDESAPNTGVYQVRPITYLDADHTRRARYVKTHPHLLLAEYDIAIWIDSNILVVGDIIGFVEQFVTSGKPIGAVPHPHRKSLLEELNACVLRNKDDRALMERQVAHYRESGFDSADLIESNLLMFDLRDARVRGFLDLWWAEIERHSKRDQLSLNYALKQSNLEWFRLTSP
jgi:TOD1/MUCI70, glycosyltransferase-like domain